MKFSSSGRSRQVKEQGMLHVVGSLIYHHCYTHTKPTKTTRTTQLPKMSTGIILLWWDFVSRSSPNQHEGVMSCVQKPLNIISLEWLYSLYSYNICDIDVISYANLFKFFVIRFDRVCFVIVQKTSSLVSLVHFVTLLYLTSSYSVDVDRMQISLCPCVMFMPPGISLPFASLLIALFQSLHTVLLCCWIYTQDFLMKMFMMMRSDGDWNVIKKNKKLHA